MLLHPILLAFQSYYALFVSTLNHGYSQFLLKAWKLYANHQLKDHLVTYLKQAWANRMSVPCSWGTHSYCAKTRVVIRNYALRS